MSVEKNELSNNVNELSSLLEQGNINGALDLTQEKSKETIVFKSDCNRIGLETCNIQEGEDGEKNTKLLTSIFNNAFNLTA